MTTADHTDYRLLFVAGLHRSGTTLLTRSLREHPKISGFQATGAIEDEGQHLQNIVPRGNRFGGPGRFGFDPRSHMDEHHELANEQSARRLFDQWSPHWDLSKPVLLEKSPPTLVRTRYFQALYSNSSFVVLTRHPIAVSLATQKWSWTTLPSLIEHWCVCHERFERDRPELRSAVSLRYEHLIANPTAAIKQVCERINLEPHETSERIRTGVNEKYFNIWRERMKSPWRRRGLHRAIDRFEPRVRTLGYSLIDLDRCEK